jgi:hypothetical protein
MWYGCGADVAQMWHQCDAFVGSKRRLEMTQMRTANDRGCKNRARGENDKNHFHQL